MAQNKESKALRKGGHFVTTLLDYCRAGCRISSGDGHAIEANPAPFRHIFMLMLRLREGQLSKEMIGRSYGLSC